MIKLDISIPAPEWLVIVVLVALTITATLKAIEIVLGMYLAHLRKDRL